ncbi:MAG: M20/M25/M40 family metallo-hydrolase [Acidobacteriota bacterium]|nr:M20/M25/M40 family metallo-hydrolase [Acidobacteriota bacterium]
MKILRISVVAAALTACALAQASASPAAVSPETRAAVGKLIGEIMVNGKAYDFDRYLADDIGPRLTGSDNYVHAVDWAVEQFKSMGLVNVHTEPFTMPALWEPETAATGEIITPRRQTLHIYSAGWSPSTPVEGVTGNIFYLPHLLPSDKLPALKSRIAGNIVLVDRASFGERPPIGDLIKALVQLNSMAPKAVLLTGRANGAQNAGSLSVDGELAAIPVGQIGQEDSMLINRLLENGPVTVHFAFENRVRPAAQVQNVVAEIRGREEPESVVIVGGHLDSWHPGTGAQDNGTGVAAVLETARAVEAIGRPPRRTLRFILFGGEEQGLVGSNAYSKAHRSEMNKIDAVLISDTGAQTSRGWYLMGRADEKKALAPIEPLLAGLGSNDTSDNTEFLFETDHAGFDVFGVPTLVLWNDVDKYFKLHHQASDTFDSVVQADLTQGVATTAATAYAIADSAQAFAPHLSQAEVDDMLKSAGELDNYKALRAAGFVP